MRIICKHYYVDSIFMDKQPCLATSKLFAGWSAYESQHTVFVIQMERILRPATMSHA